jgi:transglutaminase-like putative cysteine protease
MFRNKITTIISSISVCVLAISALIYIIFISGISYAENFINSYSTWLLDVGNGFFDKSNTPYTYLTIIFIAFIVNLLIYIFTLKFYNFYVISIMFFSIFFIQLQLGVFSSNISFILFIFSFLLYYFFDILKRRSTEASYEVGSKLKYLVNVVPICIIVIVLSFIFPMKSDRISLNWLDKKFDSAITNIINFFSNRDLANFDYFSITETGFGDDNKLGGNIKLDNTHVMDVKSENSNLYLKASSKAFYNGHSWYETNPQLTPLGNKSLSSYSTKINSDANEFINGIRIISGIYNDDEIFKTASAEIQFKNLKTKSLFIPAKTKSLMFDSSINLFYDNEQILSAGDIKSTDFKYTVKYTNLRLNSEGLKENLRKSYKGCFVSSLEKYLSRYNVRVYYSSRPHTSVVKGKNSDYYIVYSSDPSTVSQSNPDLNSNGGIFSSIDLTNINNKTETIYRRYTQLPDTVTARVRKLAEDITKGKTNNYDRAKAVETYLAENYPYTLKPGNVPSKQDFVDYFLFDGKKGYCTYYATAMTVLLRCVDIPARYVEGYILPPENKDGVFEVTNEQAHAWVEVYFEGFGWIPFEPTSPFVANMYKDNTITPSISSDMKNGGYTDYLEMMNKYRNGNSGIAGDDSYLEDTSANNKTNTSLIACISILSVVGIILLILISLVLVNLFKYYRTLIRIKKSNPNNAVLMAYSYILKVLRLLNISFEAAETPSQFGLRVEKILDFKGYSINKTSFTKITNHYVAARYSKIELNKTDQQEMLDFIKVLLKLTNEKLGNFKFVILRCFFGKI